MVTSLRHAALAAVLMAGAGCSLGGKGETQVPSSGDPEADQRAAQRVGADTSTGNKQQREQTLYERLGGDAGIARIVDDMVDRSIADPRVNFERRDVKTTFLGRKYPAWDPSPQSVQSLKQHMTEFLALASGGPSQYTGADIYQVHHGMRISNAEFDAMVGDVKASMDRLGFGAREKRDLLAIVETTRKQIVEK